MSEIVRTICDVCCNEVDAPVVAVRETVDVRGVSVTDEFWYPVCPLCGNRIGHAATMDRNFEKMYAAYREARDIPQPDEIVALRRRYGFSQRVFAAVLGIGVASVQRYEGGALPSESHAELLRQARDPQALRERLRSGAPRLGERDRERALRAVEQQAARKMDYAVVRLDLLDRLPRVALPETGLRAFDADRLREAVVYLAAHVGSLFVTKLNKVLFYLDFSAYRDEAGSRPVRPCHGRARGRSDARVPRAGRRACRRRTARRRPFRLLPAGGRPPRRRGGFRERFRLHCGAVRVLARGAGLVGNSLGGGDRLCFRLRPAHARSTAPLGRSSPATRPAWVSPAPRCGVRARLRDVAAAPDVLVSCARSEARPFARNPRATINRLLRLSMWLAGHHSPCGPDM